MWNISPRHFICGRVLKQLYSRCLNTDRANGTEKCNAEVPVNALFGSCLTCFVSLACAVQTSSWITGLMNGLSGLSANFYSTCSCVAPHEGLPVCCWHTHCYQNSCYVYAAYLDGNSLTAQVMNMFIRHLFWWHVTWKTLERQADLETWKNKQFGMNGPLGTLCVLQ